MVVLRAATHAAAAQPLLAVAIVGGALLRIAQDVVRLRDLLELLLGLLGAPVAVGVPLHGELAVGLLDVVVARIARDAERAVEISH